MGAKCHNAYEQWITALIIKSWWCSSSRLANEPVQSILDGLHSFHVKPEADFQYYRNLGLNVMVIAEVVGGQQVSYTTHDGVETHFILIVPLGKDW
jgi:hypothetical protein